MRSSSTKAVLTSTCELLPNDEILSLNGLSARNMSWEELDAALANRPVVLTVQRERRGHRNKRESGKDFKDFKV